jgi:predicted GNAT family acetyltransferase
MEFTGPIAPQPTDNIRRYRPDDGSDFHRIWSEGINDMHVRIGIPTDERTAPGDEVFKSYDDNAENEYVIEEDGKIVAMGCLSGNQISGLAVDLRHGNKGYGTRLAVFLTNEILRRGNRSAILYCESGNENAYHVYQKIGYKERYKEFSSVKWLW